MSTKSKILEYLRGRGYISGSELENQASEWETKASVISRRARELADEGVIERALSDRRTVQYKYSSMTTEQANNFIKSLEQERLV